MAGQKNESAEQQKLSQEAQEQADQEAEQKAAQEAEEQAEREAKESQAAKKAKAGRVIVTFTKPWSRYSRGDVAGFSESEADRLIKGKVAVKGAKLPAQKAKQKPEPKA